LSDRIPGRQKPGLQKEIRQHGRFCFHKILLLYF
jgi:hypothetical protein